MNVKLLTNIKRVDNNHYTAQTTGPNNQTVEFRRRLDGWNVNFVVIIDGILYNDAPTTKENMADWHDVEGAFWDQGDKLRNVLKAGAIKLGAELFRKN